MQKKTGKKKTSPRFERKHSSQEAATTAGRLPRLPFLLSPNSGQTNSPSSVAAMLARTENLASEFRAEEGRQQSSASVRSKPGRKKVSQWKAAIADECWKLGWARTDQLVRLIDLDNHELSKLFDNGELGEPTPSIFGIVWRWDDISRHVNLIVSEKSEYSKPHKDAYDEKNSIFESYVLRNINERTKHLKMIFEAVQGADDALLAQMATIINGETHKAEQEQGNSKLLEQMPDEERLASPSVYWKERGNHPELRNASIPEFIRAVYGPRLGRGFTRADLRKVDEGLYTSLTEWLRRADPKRPGYVNRLPDNLDLPTLEEWNDRQLEASGLSRMIKDPRYRTLLTVAAGRARTEPI